MSTKDLTKSELVEILEIIEGARLCADRSELKRLLLKASELTQADNSVCGIVNVSALGPVAVRDVLNGSYPEKMFDHYISGKLFLKDPVVRYHANFSITRLWTDIFIEMDDAPARQVVNYASDFGLKHGLSSAIFLPEEQSVFIISFAGPNKRFQAHQTNIADMLTGHLGNALLRCSPGLIVPPEAKPAAGVLAC